MSSYREAGVDQDAADSAVGSLAMHAARTLRGEPRGDVGGFAGLFPIDDLARRGYRRPALSLSTDGVGTKIELLRAASDHRTAGWDCVAMNVDDVVCVGAEPLVFVDYIAIERFDPDVVEAVVAGVADACVESGCELVGGETAQHPGTMPAGSYDVAGTCVGVVDLDRTWGPHRVREGDALVGLASSGLHANGFSLVRRILEGTGEEPPSDLLTPTAIYARRLLRLAEQVPLHAAAHITGGGIPGNLPRMLPEGLGARLDPTAWTRPDVFDWLAERGVDDEELRRTFNLGLGMVVACPDPDATVRALADLHVTAWHVGEVTGDPGVTFS